MTGHALPLVTGATDVELSYMGDFPQAVVLARAELEH